MTKRRYFAPDLRDLRRLDERGLYQIKARSLDEQRSITLALRRLRDTPEPQEGWRQKAELALARWQAVPGLVEAVLAEREREPDIMHRLLLGLLDDVDRLFEADAAGSDSGFDDAFEELRSQRTKITHYLEGADNEQPTAVQA